MRTRTALGVSLAVVTVAGAMSPAVAGPKPAPIKKSYTATASNPSPTNIADGVCFGRVPGSNHDTTFKAPFAGRLTVKMNGFQGDWDMALVQDGTNSAESAQATEEDISRPEEVAGFKLKKGVEVIIRACNFSGGPTASVTYTFTAL
ncbi:MAG: hypothetical protein JJD92_06745 [Frankiaceae bacterium]|nr:hypothetical protein [Frankiaceae bacterium]